MPENSNKNQQKKGKQDAKEQRKPKQGRKQHVEKNIDRVETRRAPEEVKDLKIETEKVTSSDDLTINNNSSEVLNISEEFNAKYRKKEIKSNWSKYEKPIETYEQLEEQDEGADFEKLVQMPMTAGGHFQFKHEKAWDSSATTPSDYDNYFDINMENLAVALCSVPFYERNDIDISTFTEIDITSMNNRAAKYKQKYCNDKSFTTPPTKAPGTDHICIDRQDQDLARILLAKVPESRELKPKVEQPLKIEAHLNEIQAEINVLNVNKTPETIIGDDNASSSDNTLQNLNDETQIKGLHNPADISKPVIDCPEDLEKWLDDFLDK